jgi:hypothetical protein
MLKAWEAYLEMQHHKWGRMEIYKRWFDPSVLHMHDSWRRHEMPKIKDQESSKTSRTKELTYVLDFHEFKMIHGK